MRYWKTSVVATLLAATTLAGCAGMTHREQDTAVGAAIGGASGAALTGGSAAGTLGGAAAGAIIGHEWHDIRD